MRKLQTSDIFAALRLIKKANLKEEIGPFLNIVRDEELNMEHIGVSGILRLIEIMAEKQAEQGFYEFLGGPFEMGSEEVESLEINDLVLKIEALKEENDLKSFFSSLRKLILKK